MDGNYTWKLLKVLLWNLITNNLYTISFIVYIRGLRPMVQGSCVIVRMINNRCINIQYFNYNLLNMLWTSSVVNNIWLNWYLHIYYCMTLQNKRIKRVVPKDALHESGSGVLVQTTYRNRMIVILYYMNAIIYTKQAYSFTSWQCTSKSLNIYFVICTSKFNQSNFIFLL